MENDYLVYLEMQKEILKERPNSIEALEIFINQEINQFKHKLLNKLEVLEEDHIKNRNIDLLPNLKNAKKL